MDPRKTEVEPMAPPASLPDPRADYDILRRGVGMLPRTDLATFRLWGRDPARMLNGLITNDLAAASARHAVYAAMLTPKGRMICDLRVLPVGEPASGELLVVVPAGAAGDVGSHLAKYVPPLFARWAETSETVAVLGVYGPAAARVLDRSLEGPADEREDAATVYELDGSPIRAVATGVTGAPGFDLIVAASLLPRLRDALAGAGATPIGPAALETARIEAGRPRFGLELTPETLPAEAYQSTGLMPRAISFTKGCYTGQEVVVRIAHRGHVNRHLRGLLLADAPAPEHRSAIHHPETGKEIGWTTSATYSPILGQTIAMAYLHREVAPGDEVRVGSLPGIPATVSELPFPAV
jgi:tRNA-modifying protein YgfZ